MSAAIDNRLDKVMAEITSLGEHTPEYHDAMFMLLTVMAKRQAIIAERMRQSLADSAKRRERAKRRREASEQ